ncbi:MAG: carboxypeptidase-like regulatory domain-containing protein [Planctomycetota bacterium]
MKPIHRGAVIGVFLSLLLAFAFFWHGSRALDESTLATANEDSGRRTEEEAREARRAASNPATTSWRIEVRTELEDPDLVSIELEADAGERAELTRSGVAATYTGTLVAKAGERAVPSLVGRIGSGARRDLVVVDRTVEGDRISIQALDPHLWAIRIEDGGGRRLRLFRPSDLIPAPRGFVGAEYDRHCVPAHEIEAGRASDYLVREDGVSGVPHFACVLVGEVGEGARMLGSTADFPRRGQVLLAAIDGATAEPATIRILSSEGRTPLAAEITAGRWIPRAGVLLSTPALDEAMTTFRLPDTLWEFLFVRAPGHVSRLVPRSTGQKRGPRWPEEIVLDRARPLRVEFEGEIALRETLGTATLELLSRDPACRWRGAVDLLGTNEIEGFGHSGHLDARLFAEGLILAGSSADPWAPPRAPAVVPEGENPVLVLRVTAARAIRGTVVDVSGRPQSGIHLSAGPVGEVLARPDEAPPPAAVSDEAGRFEIRGLPATFAHIYLDEDAWTLSGPETEGGIVAPEKQLSHWNTQDLRQGDAEGVVVTIQGSCTLEGVVEDEAGRAVPDALVEVEWPEGDARRMARLRRVARDVWRGIEGRAASMVGPAPFALTDAEGRFEIRGIEAARPFAVRATAADGRTALQDVARLAPGERGRCRIRLSSFATLRVVVAPAELAVTGRLAVALDVGPTEDGSRRRLGVYPFDASGRTGPLSLPAGWVRLVPLGLPEDWALDAPLLFADLRLEDEKGERTVVLNFRRQYVIEGRIEGISWPEGGRVALRRIVEDRTSPRTSGSQQWGDVDAGGRFAVAVPEAGVYLVTRLGPNGSGTVDVSAYGRRVETSAGPQVIDAREAGRRQ